MVVISRFFTLFLVVTFTTLIYEVSAVPPPEFIIQIASQIWIFFSISVAFLSAIYASFFQYIKILIPKYKNYILALGLVLIIVVSWVWAYFYDQYYQQQAQENLNQEVNQVSWESSIVPNNTIQK